MDWKKVIFIGLATFLLLKVILRKRNGLNVAYGGKSINKAIQPALIKRKGGTSERIISILKENKDSSAKEIADGLGISSRAVEKHISNLKQKNLLKRIGPDKGGHWQVT